MIRTACKALVSTILLLSFSALADQQADLERLRQRLGALQQEMEKTSDSKSSVADALRESERAISNTNRTLNQLAQQQREASQAMLQYQQQSRKISAGMQEQQLMLAQLLHQQYLHGEQEYAKLLLNNQDPNQAARELKYYEYIAKSRSSWLKALRDNANRLRSVASDAQQKSKELATLQAEQTRQKQQLLRDKDAHQQALQKIAQQLKQQRREFDRLQRDEAHLSKLVDKLSRAVAEPSAVSSAKPAASAATQTAVRAAFASLKGKLHWPVKGRISNKFGGKRPDSPIAWKGLLLQAKASQPVNAIAAGQVIYADWLRGFGNLLIIDHGAGYMSLYGYNETLYKQVGDTLRDGEVIAAVGNSGGNEHYGLYFELRHEGNPLDPEKWISKRYSHAR